MTASSSAGLLSLLSEDDERLKLYALEHLNVVVHEFWFQISSAITTVEQLYEDEQFSNRKLAALVASKVYYYLGEMRDALDYAMGAEELFDINETSSEYVQTLLSCALDLYFENQASDIETDPRLVAVIDRLLDRCCREGQFEQAVGIALEARRLDAFKEICKLTPKKKPLLTYALHVCRKFSVSHAFFRDVLSLLVELYESMEHPDWYNVCHCLTLLKEPQRLGNILLTLLKGTTDDALLAYQIGFDLVNNEVQKFIQSVQEIVVREMMAASHEPSPSETNEPTSETTEIRKRLESMKSIISGKATIKLHLDFLYSHNHADLQLLKNIKSVVDLRQSVCHSATVFANAMMHCGTTVDTFLRDNLEWLGRATNWAKFSATAGLGVIHKGTFTSQSMSFLNKTLGHLENSQALMSPYLPPNESSGSPYSEGGALFALGLIHANHGQGIQDFLLDSLKNAQNEVIQHGACLGIGIAALGVESPEIVESIKAVLYSENAVAGEAAGIALGLINVGVPSELTSELLAYAHDTQHEKIIRGISVGLAIMMYGLEEGAETLIEQMTTDQDPILRYGGMFVIGLAYAGTSNSSKVLKLLHFAVSDVSDDVRRAAMINLGFVFMGDPERCPHTLALLSESYNLNVRYGTAMAIGIACGGTGLKDACSLLQPMLCDPVDVVRQGALIAMSLVLIQSPESQVGPFRKTLEKIVEDKTEETLCRMGAIMATGILDAGGRNLTIGCRTSLGDLRRAPVIGMALFAQYWYWYPLTYFVSLVFRPAALIGLNENLDLPKFEIRSSCKKSFFAYPEPVVEEASERSGKKLPTAVLSTTERAKERAKKRLLYRPRGDQGPSTMEIDPKPSSPKTSKKGPEPETHIIENPARVVPQQEPFIDFHTNSRWKPIKANAKSGILIFKDETPGVPFETTGDGVHSKKKDESGEAKTDGDRMEIDAPIAPEPFEYVVDDE